MRILICNNFVRNGSGIDAIVNIEEKVLKSAGHHVQVFARHNSAFDTSGIKEKISLARSTLYSFSVHRELHRLLSDETFDVVHIHNTTPLLTGAVHNVLRKHSQLTVVQSLHNYRAACLYSYSYRAGHPCNLCSRFGPLMCVMHRCYRKSFAQSAALALSRGLDTLMGQRFGMHAHYHVAVSNHVRKKHIEFGIPEDNILVLKNPGKDLGLRTEKPSHKMIYVGATIEAKGVRLLPCLAGALPEYEIHVVGGGDLLPWLHAQESTHPNLHIHGFLEGEAKRKVWSNALFTLMPSLWEEPFPLTPIESFSLGIPVITTGNGGLQEIVTHGQNGFIMPFDSPGTIATEIRKIPIESEKYRALSQSARKSFEDHYTELLYARRLNDLLSECVRDRRQSLEQKEGNSP